MKVALVGKAKAQLRRQLGRFGLKEDPRNPEVVIAFGGEGTFLYAEQTYPGVPKLLLYHSSSCIGCEHDVSRYLKALHDRDYKIVEAEKVEGIVNGDPEKRLVGLNEMNVHYKLPHALRFDLEIDGRRVATNVISDGVIVSTPYGSTGYYYSITHKRFRKGFGIAINNPVRHFKPISIKSDSVVWVRIKRGDGYLACDCLDKTILLRTGDIVEIRRNGSANLVKIGKRTKFIVKA
jgi:NAD kinase